MKTLVLILALLFAAPAIAQRPTAPFSYNPPQFVSRHENPRRQRYEKLQSNRRNKRRQDQFRNPRSQYRVNSRVHVIYDPFTGRAKLAYFF